MLRRTLAIASREVRASFVTPLAYVVFSGFMLLSGFLFFVLLQQFNISLEQTAMVQDTRPSLNQWVIVPYYQTLEILLVFLVPILTMRALAEERRTGTFELLLTTPLQPAEIVLGKWIGVSLLISLMLSLAFVFPLVLVFVADPETLPVLIGFLGLVLFGAALGALGVAVSAAAPSQAIAGVSTLVLLLLFYIVDAPADRLPETVASVLHYIGPSAHTRLLLKGLVQGTDLVYFASVTLVGLFFGNRVLDAIRWR